MAEVINLRLARKARARSAAEQDAAAMRAKHGQNKAATQQARAEHQRTARLLDQARRDGATD